MAKKLVSIDYATPEEADEVANRINTYSRKGAIRVSSDGGKLEIYSTNASIGDLINLLGKAKAGIVNLINRCSSSESRGNVTGLRTS